ncbi:ABC transporter permease [Dongia sedimenti]|uniref:Xylose transport system permease protein XylH n=1 Tax=Dongia sedimenti TaxID=3064282 RepID=A0ABU0YFS7_9PROT|nr:ABC transporter permease [Rhodospirillaceae bacterium R-7]
MADVPAAEKTAQSEQILQKTRDERMKRQTRGRKFLQHPEFGALAGVILVFIFFGVTAGDSGMFAPDGVLNWSTVSAQLILIACAAALLMIGGEFDLSVGSMIGFAGMMIAIPMVYFGWSALASTLFAFAGALAVGFLNGWIVVRTRLPSFIVTLASLYILRGLTIALSIVFSNRTIVSGVKEAAGDSIIPALFSGIAFRPLFVWFAEIGVFDKLADGTPAVQGVPAVILWALGLAFIAHVILTRTRVGNWIFAAGGDANAARNVGVPVTRVKIALFMFTAFCATVYATNQIFEFGSAASDRGLLKEFEAIIAAVIGGCLLTGGYGSIVGACFGALIFGVVQMGILFTGVPNDWFRVFLGAMLLTAVLFNNMIRRRVTGER